MKLRYFFDWGGDFLWAADAEANEMYGYPANTELMPLSQVTRELAARLGRMFEEQAHAREESQPAMNHEFEDACDDLYRRIVRELGPDVEVINEMSSTE